MSKSNKAKRILAAPDLRTETVEVPEWGETVKVSEIGALERVRWARELDKDESPDKFLPMVKLLALCLVDDDGSRLFTAEEAEALANKSEAALKRLLPVCLRVNGISDADVDAVEEAEKNS